jgi:hypothetical protein
MLGNMLDSEFTENSQNASHKHDNYRNINLSTYKYNISKPEQYTHTETVLQTKQKGTISFQLNQIRDGAQPVCQFCQSPTKITKWTRAEQEKECSRLMASK